MYNLADIIRFQMTGHKSKGSLAETYLSSLSKNQKDESVDAEPIRYPNQNGRVDFELLSNIVNARKLPPVKNAICIHMRLADSCDFKCHKEKNIVGEVLKIIDKNNLASDYKKSLVFYKNHINKNESISQEIIKTLLLELEKRGIHSKCVGGDVDEDFITLSTASCYVPTFRGFSWLSASINPNQVFWDIQNPPHFNWVWNKDLIPSLNEGYEFQIKHRAAL